MCDLARMCVKILVFFQAFVRPFIHRIILGSQIFPGRDISGLRGNSFDTQRFGMSPKCLYGIDGHYSDEYVRFADQVLGEVVDRNFQVNVVHESPP
jgi:hypothetical protein